jgi:ureidoglycolate dehydrogenase (NAD+)
MNCYRAQDLEAFAEQLLRAGGYARAHAVQTAKVLVWANARGADSHGVLRIPRYIEMVEQDIIVPDAQIQMEKSEGAIAVLEAGRAPGASAMNRAMDEAVGLAERFGIGWCSARNITHAGAVGYYAQQAVAKGCIGVVMTASGPLMAYHGSSVSGVSTNPLSVAVPSGDRPLLLDMSTSTVALGKIMLAKDAGRPIPEGWAIDETGAPATDPAKVSTLTPLGGPKGSGLSLMIEVLSSLLVSNPVISKALQGERGGMNGVALAVSLSAFGPEEAFRSQVDDLASVLRALPKASGVDKILMPGERGGREADARYSSGIPLAEGTEKRLFALSDRLGVSVPDRQPNKWSA